MEIVGVDGVVYLTTGRTGDILTGAMALKGFCLADNLSQRIINDFVRAENIGKLISCITLGTHSAVSSRDLDEEENIKLETASANMQIARDRAVRDLENDYFSENF